MTGEDISGVFDITGSFHIGFEKVAHRRHDSAHQREDESFHQVISHRSGQDDAQGHAADGATDEAFYCFVRADVRRHFPFAEAFAYEIGERVAGPGADERQKDEENARLDGNRPGGQEFLAAAKERQRAEADAEVHRPKSRINEAGHAFLLDAQDEIEKEHKSQKHRSHENFQGIESRRADHEKRSQSGRL